MQRPMIRRPVLAGLLLIGSWPLAAATFTVSQAGGTAAQPGTLPWAITQSNATAGGPHTINFTTANVQLNAAVAVLPPITRNVIIDGARSGQADASILLASGGSYNLPVFDIQTSQLVWIRNLVVGGAFRNAVYAAPGSDGVILSDLVADNMQQACLHLRGTTSILRAAVRACGRASIPGATAGQRSGIWIDNADNVTLQASYVGLAADGSSTDATANAHFGVVVDSAENVLIGGTGSNRNVISNNQLGGILLQGVAEAYIRNNRIGVSVDGSQPDPNAFVALPGFPLRGGIVVSASTQVRIELGNLISANGSNVRIVDSVDVQVHGNAIGVNAAGVGGWPAQQVNGIHVTGNSQAIDIGDPMLPERANLIAFHGQNGVRLEGAQVGETRVRRNEIWQNAALGIDLVSGANGGVGAPTITAATTALISGTVPANVAADFGRVDVYRDLDDEGQVFLGTAVVDPDFATWSLPVNLSGLGPEWRVTATSNTFGLGTSRFSPSRPVTPGVVDLIFANGFQSPL